MSLKIFRIASAIVLACLALSSTAWAACSSESLSGAYGFLHNSTSSDGAPATAVSQLTFDPTTATFTIETTASHDGVVATESTTGTYAIDSNCTGTGAPAGAAPFALVVTSTGFLAAHLLAEGFAVKQGSATCTNAGVEGSFGFETTGVIVAGAPGTRPVAFIGELELSVNTSGEGVISGNVASSEDGTFLTFADEPVTGSYSIDSNCRGTATIVAKERSVMHFRLVVVDGGKEMLVVQTDGGTVVSGALQR